MRGESVECGVCGGIARVAVTDELTRADEPVDMEGRPANCDVAFMSTWLAECPKCGYAGNLGSLEVSEDHREDLRELVLSDEYIRCGQDLPAVARRFLRRAMIAERSGDERFAGNASLHAAWVCDAEGEDDSALVCRDRAIEYWHDAHAEGDALTDDNDPARDGAVMAETMRRAARFSEAIDQCREALPRAVGDDLRCALETILSLASAHNAGSSTP